MWRSHADWVQHWRELAEEIGKEEEHPITPEEIEDMKKIFGKMIYQNKKEKDDGK